MACCYILSHFVALCIVVLALAQSSTPGISFSSSSKQRSPSDLSSYQPKVFALDTHVAMGISGLSSDARSLAYVTGQQRRERERSLTVEGVASERTQSRLLSHYDTLLSHYDKL